MHAEKESAYPADWLEMAEEDFRRVPRRLAEDDIADAAFHLQQALEKYLKGFLLSSGWKLERIHDLRALLEEAAKHEPKFRGFRHLCAEITAYYVQERYPVFGKKPSRDEVEANLDQAEDLVRLINDLTGSFDDR
jgi:HEPN domain-containing protein